MSAAERLLDTDQIRSQARRWQPGLRARLLLAFGGSATFIFSVAILIHLFGLPVVGVNGELQRHRAEVEDFLSVLADRLADRLQQWLSFQRHQAGLASESLATSPAGDDAAALARLRPHLPEAATLLILDRQGRLLAANSRDARQTPALRAELVAHAFASTQDETIDVDTVDGCPGPHLLVLRRFTRVGGEPCLLACAFHAHDELLARLSAGLGRLGHSYEIVLVDQDRRLLTPLRRNLAGNGQGIPLHTVLDAQPARLAAAGSETLVRSPDYSGVPTFAATRHVRLSAGHGWGLVLKVDQDEALAGLRASIVNLLICAAVGIVFALLVALVLAQRLTQPVRRLSAAARAVAHGDLSARSAVAGADEIGLLGQVFDAMAARIEAVQHDLEVQVAERTRDLAEREEHLRTTLLSIGDGVVVCDAEGRVTRLNPVAENLTGWSDAEAQGRQCPEVFHIVNQESRAPVESPVAKVLALGRIVGLANHTVLISRDGTERAIADSGAPIRGRDGRITGVVLVFRDVSDQYRLEEQLRQAQKLNAIGQLAGGVAHDFNNMLAGILGFASFLVRRLADQPQLRDWAERIMEAGQRAAGLTDKLLAFARKAKTRSSRVDLHRLIHDTVGLLSHTVDKRIRIETRLEATRAWLHGDPSLLQTALLNLAVNARDAMPEGGTLSFRSRDRRVDDDGLVIGAHHLPAGDYLELAIADTGIGMGPEILAHLFEPFFTTKEVGKGTGLGLAAVWGAISDHQGGIGVESAPGQGTTFTILLPVPALDEAGLGSGAHALPSSGRLGTILVVDDEPLVRELISSVLTQTGHRVRQADGGTSALALYADAGSPIDLVVLDLVMPDLDGRATLLELRRRNPSLKVLITSGYNANAPIADLLGQPGIAFLNKPFSIDDLTASVDALLSGPRPSLPGAAAPEPAGDDHRPTPP